MVLGHTTRMKAGGESDLCIPDFMKSVQLQLKPNFTVNRILTGEVVIHDPLPRLHNELDVPSSRLTRIMVRI